MTNENIRDWYEKEFFEQDISKESYVDELVDNDAIEHHEAAFLLGYNDHEGL